MSDTLLINGIAISNPERVYWPDSGLTKRDLVEYYDQVAPLMLPYVKGRPLTMVRCPGGIAQLPDEVRRGERRADACFYHKHPAPDFPGPFERVMITEAGGPAPYLVITEPASLTALAQMGVLEVHVWGSTAPDIEHPDLLVFDLDPDVSVAWPALAEGTLLVREVLRAAGLQSFVKTTGGKGLHVVVPVEPSSGWDAVRSFCKAVADTIVSLAPERFIATMSKAKRSGKIYVDYVRNTRGSTAIAPFSTRAREGATVAYPLHWDELQESERPRAHSLVSLSQRLEGLKEDPWQGYFDANRGRALG